MAAVQILFGDVLDGNLKENQSSGWKDRRSGRRLDVILVAIYRVNIILIMKIKKEVDGFFLP